ncbi:MAG: hypothetical protein HQM00_09695, partial [Magnetococcales bacterium]|nr:hypothetical protein [Magnetococcales bacterium]
MSPTRVDLLPFKRLIKLRCGLHFETNNEENLRRALLERCGHLGVIPEEYLTRLHTQEHEFQELVNRLTVNETYFFREAEQITLLVERLAPRLLVARARHPGGAPVRTLSAG